MSILTSLSAPFLAPIVFVKNIFRIVIGGVIMGIQFGGNFTGVWNTLKAAFRGRCYREDGLQLTSALRVDSITWPGFPWFSAVTFKEMLESLHQFPIRDDDILIISYPKCGHHFIFEVLNMLIKGEAKLAKGVKGDHFLEMFGKPEKVFSKMASPRIIMTHLPFNFIPKHILESKCRIIRISRNPKDTLVSYYNHVRAIEIFDYDDPLDNFLRLNLETPCHAEYGSYFDFERDYLQGLSGRDNVILLTFENMKKDSVNTFKSLGEFLRMDYPMQFYEQVATESDFKKVKAAKAPAQALYCRKGQSLYRRGVVGDWRNHITVAMNEIIDAKIQKEWGGTELITKFDYGED